MKRENESTGNSQQSTSVEFAISRFHLGRHIFALVVTIGLCFSLIMSEVSNHTLSRHHHTLHLSQVILPYLLMLLFVGAIFITTVLTARKIKTSKKGIEISNLFWREKLNWTDLQTFKSPPGFQFAWLKTKYVLYILPKNEFKNWSELERLLQDHFPIIKIERQ